MVQQNWAVLAEQRARLSAEFLFLCLQNQRDPGVAQVVQLNMDSWLWKLLPLSRRTVTVRAPGDLHLLQAIWFFDADKAIELLKAIDYPDFIQDLHALGIDETKELFIQKAVQAARAHQICAFYAR